MRHTRLLLALSLAAAAAVAVPSLATSRLTTCTSVAHPAGGDWPVLGGDLHQTNFQAAERTISAENVAQLQLVWASGPDVQPGVSTPIVAGRCVYVTSNGWLYALDAGTGKLVWRTPQQMHPSNDWGLAYYPQGVSVVGGRVHVDEGGNNAPRGDAFDAATGEHLWTSVPVTFGYRSVQISTPKVALGLHLLFTTGPDYDAHGRPGYALLDERTGKVLARHSTIPPKLLAAGYSGGGVWASAAVDSVRKYAFVGTSNPYTKTKESPYDNAIVKIDLDRARRTFGSIVGVYKGTPDAMVAQAYDTPACQTLGPVMPEANYTYIECGQQDGDFAAGPTLFRDSRGRTLLAELQKDGTLHAVDTATMQPVWTLALGVNSSLEGTSGNGSVAAFDGKHLYVVFNPGTLTALAPDTGAVQWALPLQEDYASYRPVVAANGVVYTIGAFDRVVIAHDAETGNVLATLDPTTAAGSACSAGQSGGMAIAHHLLYVNCGSYLAAFGLPHP